MEEELKQTEQAILNLAPEMFESNEQYRKYILGLSKKLGAKLKEGADEVLNEELLKEYTKVLMDSCYLELGKFPPVPTELKVKERVKSGKHIIKQVLETYKYPETPALIKNIRKSILRSSSISELRSNLRLWQSAQEILKEKDRLEDEVNVLDQQICFDTRTEELLEYYKKQNEELIEALTANDEEYILAKQVHGLHKEGKGRPTIAKELNIPDRKVRTLLEKYKFA